jgi:hydroxymethylpyrimidine/phosphomethylpyrimidine kinase
VSGVHVVPAGFVREQLETLLDDVRIDAVKIGMIANAEIAGVIGSVLRERGLTNIVLDPVMVAKGGDRLLAEDAVAAVREELLPLASVVTPNLPEAGELLGQHPPADEHAMEGAARQLLTMGAKAVLMKGGHLEGGRSDDLLVTRDGVTRFEATRIETKNTHGTGCTLSSAIAALLPGCGSVEEAVQGAKNYISGAIAHADELEVGSGHGPTHHFFELWVRGKSTQS